MCKKLLVSLVFCVAFQQLMLAQSPFVKFLTTNQYGVVVTTEPFSRSLGKIVTVSRVCLDSKHVESLLGIAIQDSYTFRSKFEKNISPKITAKDYGFYLTNDWRLYPFKKKTLFLNVGLFSGVTQYISKGKLELPEYGVSETFYKKYTYFNYGTMQSLGWCFSEKYEVGLYSMISLKGVLDKGRTRPAEVDSRFFVGLNFVYKFKEKEEVVD